MNAPLTEEHASLRRVATLVARGLPPSAVFSAVVGEAAGILGADFAGMSRYEPDGSQTVVAAWPPDRVHVRMGTRLPMYEGANVARMVLESKRPARIDDWSAETGPVAESVQRLGVRSSVAAPIEVAGRLWGVAIVDSCEGPLAPDTEARLLSFTELTATAVANSDAREELGRLAQEQSALRRVATLVARGLLPGEGLLVVAEEAGRLLDAEIVHMVRYDSDDALTVVASWSDGDLHMAVGTHLTLDDQSTAGQVLRTGQPARVDDYRTISGPIAQALRDLGIRSTVGCPIVVDGQTWGAMIVASVKPDPQPPQTEARMTQFTELVATAIANEASRDALAASRARIVTAGDQARQRIERNLHDGAQQRLVSLGLVLRAAEAQAPPELREVLGEAVGSVGQIVAELQEISRGLHPAALSSGGGLEAALGALARRSAVPAELDLRVDRRLPEPVEVALYYIVSEALTNAAKHAGASHVAISAFERDGVVELVVRDDGAGGADPAAGSGLIGLRDRVEAIGGRIEVDSPPGAGTALHVTLPA